MKLRFIKTIDEATQLQEKGDATRGSRLLLVDNICKQVKAQVEKNSNYTFASKPDKKDDSTDFYIIAKDNILANAEILATEEKGETVYSVKGKGFNGSDFTFTNAKVKDDGLEALGTELSNQVDKQVLKLDNSGKLAEALVLNEANPFAGLFQRIKDNKDKKAAEKQQAADDAQAEADRQAKEVADEKTWSENATDKLNAVKEALDKTFTADRFAKDAAKKNISYETKVEHVGNKQVKLSLVIKAPYIVAGKIATDPTDEKNTIVSVAYTPTDVVRVATSTSLDNFFRGLEKKLGVQIRISDDVAKRTGSTEDELANNKQADADAAAAEEQRQKEEESKSKVQGWIDELEGIKIPESLNEDALEEGKGKFADWNDTYKTIQDSGKRHAFVKLFLFKKLGFKPEDVPEDNIILELETKVLNNGFSIGNGTIIKALMDDPTKRNSEGVFKLLQAINGPKDEDENSLKIDATTLSALKKKYDDNKGDNEKLKDAFKSTELLSALANHLKKNATDKLWIAKAIFESPEGKKIAIE